MGEGGCSYERDRSSRVELSVKGSTIRRKYGGYSYSVQFSLNMQRILGFFGSVVGEVSADAGACRVVGRTGAVQNNAARLIWRAGVTGARYAANAFGGFVTAFKVQRAQSMEQPASSGKRGRGEE